MIKVTRTIVHKKRIAPKGCVFFVAKGEKMELSILVNTKGSTPEAEQDLIGKLVKELEQRELNLQGRKLLSIRHV